MAPPEKRSIKDCLLNVMKEKKQSRILRSQCLHSLVVETEISLSHEQREKEQTLHQR